MLRTLLLATLLAVVTSSPALATNGGKSTVQDLVGIFSQWSGKSNDKSVFEAAAQHIDYQFMAQKSLGDNQWSKLNATQKREFSGALKRLVERRYYPRWHRIFYKAKMSYLSEAPSKDEVWVKTDLLLGKKHSLITWRLHSGKTGELMVMSLTVGEKDLLNRMTTRFQKQLANKGFEGLLAWLRDKLDEDEDDNESINSTALSII